MESLERCVRSLDENEADVRNEARRALLSICRSVLGSPSDDKSRELRLDNEVVTEKLLPAIGAMECLFDVGYVEDGERIFLPHDASLSRLEGLSRLLSTAVSRSTPAIRDTVRSSSGAQKAFFDRITGHFHSVMHYEDPNLQQKARRVVPVAQLEIAVMTKMRELQRSLKLNGAEEAAQFETELVAKDLLLIELLRWFKHEFFKWVNSPACSVCSMECVYESVTPSADPRCSRIELHRCEKCNIVVEFPRYSHPEPLLTLRRGRCGEWANVFTLLCRSLGYDARFVCDETDHVWTEVWSIANERWIHLDPCENATDKPLMYEKGWKKKLTYIIAYSRDEVQDVTWRYTRDQEAVMKRRRTCAEQSLMRFVRSLSEQRQNSSGYSSARREYVVKRSLLELAGMLYIPNSRDQDSDESYEGRTSGSIAWRLARGEISQRVSMNTEKNCTWELSKYGQSFELRYNIVSDVYHVVHNGTTLEQKSGWLEGMSATEGGIFRKVENDWRMVYLARSPRAEHGRVKWTFEIANSRSSLEAFGLEAKSKAFRTEEVRGAVKLNVIVKLSGGEGELAWQHAQLFRQSLEKIDEPSMIISIKLRNRA
ncbi:Peptide-N(4)-(N-acetyl-beta-glucosaminyl)asparagine amidase [Ooceraea biroi]|uniref:Peptide-N(4)-(N-acetyl-beta-glucosaminyl)asparagine amidase n=1 Tax=Ooceraea biroi TaxID=2015173 RepID=A0A026W467_OOCBI|nr:Peptide-N(4)-(N-acetyl-beta-glucosaminyl)asparagine amidase [Ooceraea biroi]